MNESEQFKDGLRESLKQIVHLVDKHKLVAGLVHKQIMQKHDLVETLVQKQHLAELKNIISRLNVDEMACVIEEIPSEYKLLVWEQVQSERGDDILERVSDEIREMLVGAGRYQGNKVMLNAFELLDGKLRQIQVIQRDDLDNLKPIWVDLVGSNEDIRDWVGEHYQLELPNPNELTDLETSARFYVEDNGEIYLISDFLLDMDDAPRNVPVAFILHQDILFSLRQEELPVFRLQRLRGRTQPGYVSDAKDVLLSLYSADTEYSADALEDVYAGLEAVSKEVLNSNMTDANAAKTLADIAAEEDLNGRIRRNVLDTRRAVSFLMRGKLLSEEQQENARQILRDIESLDGHTSFLFGKINFLMDATVGFININQNKIIKIFSVASVALLPPTLIASIYGMNFKGWFPEINWQYGYIYALVLMAVSVVIPFYYFRRKGWLN